MSPLFNVVKFSRYGILDWTLVTLHAGRYDNVSSAYLL